MSADASAAFGAPDNVGTGSDWLTPSDLREYIYATWALNFDPCPYPRASWDGLEIEWGRADNPARAFVNPPYGRGVGDWLAKAISEIGEGRCEIAVFLIHARTDTRWFHEYILGGAQELHFIEGRVKFERPGGPAESSPFPSLIAVFYSSPRSNELGVRSWGKASQNVRKKSKRPIEAYE